MSELKLFAKVSELPSIILKLTQIYYYINNILFTFSLKPTVSNII